MCGIAGIAVLNRSDINIGRSIFEMSRTIAHRGPDDEGFVLLNNQLSVPLGSSHTDKNVWQSSLNFCPNESIEEYNNEGLNIAFCHRRLSILDLSSSGHQPMCDADSNYWITFNGEIYNYIEIREELISEGYNFRTQSDTEVIINAYKCWGSKCVERFNGMWAFVIYDKKSNSLFASRDRFGVKPFYYYFKDGVFCFASEQKAIVKADFVKTRINNKAVYDFLAYNEEEYEQEGFFENIIELFPSHNLQLSLNELPLRIEKYYDLPFNSTFEDFSEDDYLQHVQTTKHLFENSIQLRLRSDVAVGCCLSGGIDSSAIAGVMDSLNTSTPIHLFTATFSGENIDESKWAKLVADSTRSVWHQTTPNEKGLFNELEDLVYCQDIPLWSTSTYAQFKVMELAKKSGIKVVLDGQGGDELFAGYAPYYSFYWNELAANKGGKAALSELKKRGPLSKEIVHWLKEKSKHESGILSSLRKLIKDQKNYLDENFASEHQARKNHPLQGSLNEVLKQEFTNSRLKLYLKCEDRCGMWHSVESRTPFSDDIHLIENTFKIASSYKLNNGKSKSLLRDAVKDVLPKEIYERKDKMGYVTPNNRWLAANKNLIKEIIGDTLNEFIDKKKIHTAIDELDTAKSENTIVFKALTFAVWRKKFLL